MTLSPVCEVMTLRRYHVRAHESTKYESMGWRLYYTQIPGQLLRPRRHASCVDHLFKHELLLLSECLITCKCTSSLTLRPTHTLEEFFSALQDARQIAGPIYSLPNYDLVFRLTKTGFSTPFALSIFPYPQARVGDPSGCIMPKRKRPEVKASHKPTYI